MTDAEDSSLANTPAQAESLLHRLEQAAGGISFNVNVNKTEFMCFKQETISQPLKLDKFTPRQQYLIYWKWC